LLDEALVGLRSVDEGVVCVRDARDALVPALEHVYLALAATGDYSEFKAEITSALELAQFALGYLQCQETSDGEAIEEMSLVARAVGGLLEVYGPVPAEADLDLPGNDRSQGTIPQGALPASGDEPRLLHPSRAVLRPVVPLPEEPVIDPVVVDIDAPAPDAPVIGSLADLQAYTERAMQALAAAEEPATEEHDAFVPEQPEPEESPEELLFGSRVTTEQVLIRRARDLFDDLSMMGIMRQPDEGDFWKEMLPLEQRLLARVDGLMACGTDLFPGLVQLLEESPVADPDKSWGLIFLYGSMAGSDALHQVLRLVRSSDISEDAVFEAVSDALALAPQPGIDGVMAKWTEDRDATTRRLALRVLSRRATGRVESLLPHLEETAPAIVVEAVRALEVAEGEVTGGHLAKTLRHDVPEVLSAATECCLARGLPAGIARAEHLVRSGRADFGHAALYCAIASREGLGQTLIDASSSSGAPGLFEALGWYGDAAAVPFALDALRAGNHAALLTLQRITGASLSDAAPLPEYGEGETPFLRDGLWPEPEVELSVDADLWSEWWGRYRQHVDRSRRYRWGHLWTLDDDLWEIDEAPASMRCRRLASLELAARTGGRVRFDPRDFVLRQQRQVRRWREHTGARGERASRGSWTSRAW